jgi:prepilin-type N-terminal cleavage/methylation domain-containing protein
MPMSGSCHRSDHGGRAAGFTLLELLIVLALIGLTAAMVVPRLVQTYDAIVASGERAEVVRALEDLPLRVRIAGHADVFEPVGPSQADTLVEAPDGWAVRLLDPLRIERTGICHPSRVQVRGRGTTETWRITAPSCEVADEE